jgi:hypothetical protein
MLDYAIGGLTVALVIVALLWMVGRKAEARHRGMLGLGGPSKEMEQAAKSMRDAGPLTVDHALARAHALQSAAEHIKRRRVEMAGTMLGGLLQGSGTRDESAASLIGRAFELADAFIVRMDDPLPDDVKGWLERQIPPIQPPG